MSIVGRGRRYRGGERVVVGMRAPALGMAPGGGGRSAQRGQGGGQRGCELGLGNHREYVCEQSECPQSGQWLREVSGSATAMAWFSPCHLRSHKCLTLAPQAGSRWYPSAEGHRGTHVRHPSDRGSQLTWPCLCVTWAGEHRDVRVGDELPVRVSKCCLSYEMVGDCE